MKFERIILISGLNPKDYPVAGIPVEVLDEENCKLKEEDMNFVRPIFSKNLESKKRFGEFLERECSKQILPDTMIVRITEAALVVFVPNCGPEIFFRFN